MSAGLWNAFPQVCQVRAGTVRLGLIARIFSGGTPDRDNIEFWEGGALPWIGSGAVNQFVVKKPTAMITEAAVSASSTRLMNKGSIILALAGQGKTKGMCAQMGIDAYGNQSLACITDFAGHNRFLLWWLTALYREIRGLASQDTRDGLNQAMIRGIPVPLYTLDTQHRIADFLDRETARIDQLIEKKQRLVALLEEKRSALATWVVTKGLDSAAPMKYSNLEWVREIPENWTSAIKMNILAKPAPNTFVNGPFGSDLLTSELQREGTPVIYIRDIRNGHYEHRSKVFITSEKAIQIDFCRTDPGDVLIAKVGDPPGVAAVYPEGQPPAVVTQDVIRVKIDPSRVDPHYLVSLLNSGLGQSIIELISVKSTRTRISLGAFKKARIILPPLDEQVMIAADLKAESMQINNLVDACSESITLLHEFRSALITAAVTGQIDVDEWTRRESTDRRLDEIEEEMRV